MLVSFKNPKVSEYQRTALGDDVAAAGGTLTILDTSGFAAGDTILIGELGTEKTEIQRISTVASVTSITLVGTTSFAHAQNTPIYKIYYNQLEIQFRTSSVGAWTAIVGMPISLTVDETHTAYNHAAGLTTYEYRARYYNSYTTTYSEWSATFPASGYDRNTLQYMIDQVYLLANDLDETQITRAQIAELINEAQDEISKKWDKWYFLRREDSTLKTVADTATYTLPTSCERVIAVRYEYDDTAGNTLRYRLRRLPEVVFDAKISDREQDSSDDLEYYTIRAGTATYPQGYIEVYPTPDTANNTFYILQMSQMTELTDPDDETIVPRPRILVDYVLGNIADIRKKPDEAAYWFGRFEKGVAELKQLSKRSAGQREFLMPYGRRGMYQFYGEATSQDRDALHESYW